MRVVIRMETTYMSNGASYADRLSDLAQFVKVAQREARRQGLADTEVFIDFGIAYIGAEFGQRRDPK